MQVKPGPCRKAAGRVVVLVLLCGLIAGGDVLPTAARQAADPLVWWSPLMPSSVGTDGSADFRFLFDEGAPWPITADHLDVFKFYAGWLLSTVVPDERVQMALETMERHGIAIAVETNGLVLSPTCGQTPAGYLSLQENIFIADRIQRLGGSLDYVGFDGPLYWGHLYQGEGGCRWTLEETVHSMMQTIAVYRQRFPDVKIVFEEYISLINPETGEVNLDLLNRWLDTYEAMSGERFDHLQLDHEYKVEGWVEQAATLQAALAARGIGFAPMIFGDYYNRSDAEWLALSEFRLEIYEGLRGQRPDHLVFQSWQELPDFVLPETDPDTYSHHIGRYWRERPTLAVEPALDGGVWQIGGTLTASGGPIAGAPIYVSVETQVEPGSRPRGPVLDEEALRVAHDLDRNLNGMVVASTTTDASGAFRLDLPAPLVGAEIVTWYPGTPAAEGDPTAGYRPAFHTMTTGAPAINLALGRPAIASQSNIEEPPERAVDGSGLYWCASSVGSHWLEVDLQTPAAISGVSGTAAQWPDRTNHHQVWARQASGRSILIAAFETTGMGGIGRAVLPAVVPDVRAVRFATVDDPAVPCWFEVEVWSGEAAALPACILSAQGGANIRGEPSTDAPVVLALGAGQGALALGQTVGGDGFTWWQVPGGWVRADVAVTDGGCDHVPASGAASAPVRVTFPDYGG